MDCSWTDFLYARGLAGASKLPQTQRAREVHVHECANRSVHSRRYRGISQKLGATCGSPYDEDHSILGGRAAIGLRSSGGHG